MKLLKTLLLLIVTGMAIMITVGCTKSSNSSTEEIPAVRLYGGTMPVGDFVSVTIDTTASTVTHYNYTTGQINGPFSYTQITDPNVAGGFSILYRATVSASQYVIFAEFPGAACVYQMFNATTGQSVGWPQYVVYRKQMAQADLYEKSFIWMKFLLDPNTGSSSPKDNMECGFAAFDDVAHNGLMYGAGYSHRDDVRDPNSNTYHSAGINNCNVGNNVKVDTMTPDANTLSLMMWTGGVGIMNSAIALTGTPSGAAILDFGPGVGGGAGLVVPQTNAVDDLAAWWGTTGGTYFLLVYTADMNDATAKRVEPLKMTVENSGTAGSIKVFQMSANTATGTPVFTNGLERIEDLAGGSYNSGSGQEAIKTSFANVSGNAAASSNIVKSAHLCKGGFIAQDNNGNVLMIAFDPQGRFVGFTGFFKEPASPSGTKDIIRFGFGIRDTKYSNTGLK